VRAELQPTTFTQLSKMGMTNAERQRRWRQKQKYIRNQQRWPHCGSNAVSNVNEPRRSAVLQPGGKVISTPGEPMEDVYYQEDIHRKPESASQVVVERVLRQQYDADNVRESLVKFVGLPHKFNRWLTDSELHHHTASAQRIGSSARTGSSEHSRKRVRYAN
jgi:hypothetical protein